MNAKDFYKDWVQSALNDRFDAQSYRRRAKLAESVGSSSENTLWLARRSYQRALYDLEQARSYRSQINASQ